MLDLAKVKHFEWVIPVVHAIQTTFLSKRSFYEVVNFDLFDHHMWFIICWSGKWNSASKVTVQANCPLTFTFPFCCDALHMFNFSFVKYVYLGEKCVCFFSLHLLIFYPQKRYISYLKCEVYFQGYNSLISPLSFSVALWAALWITLASVIFFSSEAPTQKTQAEWRRISVWMTLHIL